MASITGSITGTAQTVLLSVGNNNAISVSIKGTYAGVELFFEATVNGTDYFSVALQDAETGSLQSSSHILTNESRIWSTRLQTTLVDTFRVRSVAYTSGTGEVIITASVGEVIGDPITGSALIGQQATSNSLPVTIASDQDPIDVEVVGDNQGTSASGRLRTAEPITIFDHFFNQDDGSLFWDQSVTGGGAITRNATQGLMDLVLGTASGDKAVHQTRTYFPHQAGKGHQILMTGVMGAIKTNVRQRIGYFDANDGLFFEQDGTNLKMVRRTSTSGAPVDNVVAQSSWNIDKLDGTGTSGETIDMSKNQLMVIDFEWLGAGRVRMGFQIGGTTIYCHQFLTSNVLSLPYMKTPSLPVRYEIENTGVAASGTTMKQVCCTVISEGGWNPLGIVRCADSGTSLISVQSPFTPIVSIRLKSGNNRATVFPTGISTGVTNGKDLLWRLIHGGSLTGASWSSLSSTSFVEIDNSASAITGGEVVACGFVSADQAQFSLDVKSSLWLASDIAGISDILTFTASRIGNGTAMVYGSISFKEQL